MADEEEQAEIEEAEVVADDAEPAAAEGAAGNEEAIDDDAVAAEWAAMMEAEEAEEAAGGGAGAAGGPADSLGGAPGRILGQEEIDNLLGFDPNDGDGVERSGIMALVENSLVSYERLPMLEIIFDRLVRMMTTSMRNFTSDNVEVSLDQIQSVRFGPYLNSVPLPAILGVFRVEEWDNYGLITVDSNLIYSIVDVLLGGRKGTMAMRVEGRPYTSIERNLVERLLGIVLRDLEAAFEPLSAVNFMYERLETNPRFATIAGPANAAILVKFRVDMEDRGGRLEMVLPYATLEPVREMLVQMFMGEKFGRDSIWESHLATEVWNSEIAVEAVLDEQIMRLGDVINLQVGDTVMLNTTPESDITVRCGEIPLVNGKMGRVGRQVAVCVEPHESPLSSLATDDPMLEEVPVT